MNTFGSSSKPIKSSILYFKLKQIIISLITLIAFTPAFLGITGIYQTSKNELITAKGVYLRQFASLTALEVEEIIDDRLSTLMRLAFLTTTMKVLSNNPATAKSAKKEFGKFIDFELTEKNIDFVLYNLVGAVVFSTAKNDHPAQSRDSAPDISGMGQDVYVSDILSKEGPSGEDYYLDIYVPVTSIWGNPIGSIRARFVINELFDIVKRVKLGKTGHANLVTSKGEIIIYPLYEPKSHTITEGLLKRIDKNKHGWSMVKSGGHGESEALIGYAPVSLSNKNISPASFGKKRWIIYTRQEPEETFEAIQNLKYSLIALILPLILFAVVLALIGSRLILKAQKLYEAEKIRREKQESSKQILFGFQEMVTGPLSELRKYLSKDKKLEESKTVSISTIRKQIEGIESLIEYLAYYSKTKETLLLEMDLVEIINSSLEMLKYLFDKHKVAVKVVAHDNKVPIMGNERMLNVVFMNIIMNAIHAVKGGGEITITTGRRENSGFCTIMDNGSGIPEKDLNHIFDPFFTTKKQKQKGYGLGLFISHEIMETLNGEIEVQSEKNLGATITLIFKLAETEIKEIQEDKGISPQLI